jgi:hypothetical protein
MRKFYLTSVAAVLFAASAQADTYTYKYVGTTFAGGTDHVEVTFTTSAPLAPSKSYLDTASANVISGNLSVVGPSGVVSGLSLPFSPYFQIHTNATASATTPGIDAWYVWADANTLTGTPPTSTGVDYQSYTMNTMAFIPGSDIPNPGVSLVTGHYNYDQGTIVSFYASCTGVPGCTLAGNGQPYVSNYSGIINPANTSAANWTLTVNVTQPVPPPVPPLALTGSLPDGVVFTPYSASITATGGTTPYSWTATGLPTGLTINSTTGVVSGTPTAVGSYATTVTAADSAGKTASASSTIVISAPTSCTAPGGAKQFENKGKITKVGAGYIVVGTTVIYTAACTKVEWNGAKGFAVGQVAESQGFTASGANYATQITIN